MPDVTYIDRYISDGKAALISLSKFYDTILIVDNNKPEHIFRIPLQDTFLKYREHLANDISMYELPNSFLYKPKLLSIELYGTTEMWLSILRLNNMRNVAEFNRPIVKVYTPASIRDLIQLFFKREGKIS